MSNQIFGHEAEAAAAPPVEHPPAEPGAHHDDHNSPERIRKEIRTYLWVFAALAFLTGLTVWLCFGLHMEVHKAIAIALVVATVKGALVAGFFMHLFSERKLIYWILGLTVFFFAVLMWGPAHEIYDKFGKQ